MNEFVFYINQGKITNPIVVKKAFDILEDGAYLCRIHTRKQRSLPQNAYYHSIVVEMVREGLRDAGYDEVKTNEDAHEVLKSLFLKKQIVNHNTGEVLEIPGSTVGLTTVQFSEFIEQVWKWSAEFLGIHIPAPNEQLSIYQS